MPPLLNASLPPRPRLAIRVGFAGRRDLSAPEQSYLEQALAEIFDIMEKELEAIAKPDPLPPDSDPPVSHYFSAQPPLIRLITGLCEGADTIASTLFERGSDSRQDALTDASVTSPPRIERESAAVIPFDVEAYRRSRPNHFHAEFDRQLAKCAWVLALDGIFEKPNPDTPIAITRRARAYRAQSTFLLRHCDVLIAAGNPDESGKAGGTLETVRESLAFEIPVVFLHTGTGEMYLIDPQGDLYSALVEKAPTFDERKTTLRKWISQITIDPDNLHAPAAHDSHRAHKRCEDFLREFFDDPQSPSKNAARLTFRLRKATWTWFEGRFRSGEGPRTDPRLSPYSDYRARATALSNHYGGLYRGAFFLNYVLAIVAVVLAAVSLVILGSARHTSAGNQVTTIVQTAGPQASSSHSPATHSTWLLPTLFGLAALKLVIVAFIVFNTRQANRNGWNDRAVDYRYLAERLRAMYYLPLAGSCQPPAAAPPQFASRVVRQSRVDWLFEAIVRSISPAEFPAASSAEIPAEIPAANGQAQVHIRKLWRLQPVEAIKAVNESWISEQAKYHLRNANTMQGLHHFTERYSSFFGWTVIGIVSIDLLIVVAEIFHWIPHAWESWARFATPWLVFISAILPAVVAALNGIRFQSECQRLAERSFVMSAMLRGRAHPKPGESMGRLEIGDRLALRIREAQASPAYNPGTWSSDTLRFTEQVATDFVQEAAEWSVLYTKEVSDPG